MSNRPTFMKLINAYRLGCFREGVAWANAMAVGSRLAPDASETDGADEAEQALVRALRKAGIPLDSVAP